MVTVVVEDRACLDIAAIGLWGDRLVTALRKHLWMCWCTQMLHPTEMPCPLSSCYMRHEKTKKRTDKQRAQEVEHAPSTPIVLSSNGWDGQWSYSFLQDNGLQPSCKMWFTLQLQHVLSLLPDNFLLAEIGHSEPLRCSFQCGTCPKIYPSSPPPLPQ